jgi:hypothetical protein
MNNFYDSWKFLEEHPIFQKKYDTFSVPQFQQCLDIAVTKVNPANCTMEVDETKNTKVEVWLEAGPYAEGFREHDIDLDCGGDTFEEAIIALAVKVLDKYGDYETEE